MQEDKKRGDLGFQAKAAFISRGNCTQKLEEEEKEEEEEELYTGIQGERPRRNSHCR